MGWKTSLPCHRPYDNLRRLMSHCPSCNRLSSEGKGARTSTCEPTGPTTLQILPFQRFPYEGCSGDGGSDCQPSPHQPPKGQDCNRCWRDHRPPSPCFPLPFPDHGFQSDRSLLFMASLILSRSDRSDRSWAFPKREMALGGQSLHEDKTSCLQR